MTEFTIAFRIFRISEFKPMHSENFRTTNFTSMHLDYLEFLNLYQMHSEN